jgi:predicted RNase H-like nuclease (RuvC/YqgF family)
MLNNRKTINDLKEENSKLKLDIENKENTIVNLLDANKELSIANTYLEKKINMLEKVLNKKELIICDLNMKLFRAEGKIDKIENMIGMLGGNIND